MDASRSPRAGAERLVIRPWHVEPSVLPVASEILPEVGQLQRRAQRVRRSIEGLVSIAGDAEHQPADRVGRAGAVVEHVNPALVAAGRHILAERTEQIREQRDRQIVLADGIGDGDEDQIVGGRRRSRCRRRRHRGGAASRREGEGARAGCSRARRRNRRRAWQTRRRRRSPAACAAAAGATRPESSRSAPAPAPCRHRRRAAGQRERSPPRWRSPLDFRDAGAMVDGSRHGEEEIRQSIDVLQQLVLERSLAELHHRALGPAADGPRHVQGRTRGRAAGENETAQRRNDSRRIRRSSAPSRATSSVETAAFVTRPAMRCDGSARRAPTANRSRWICWSCAADVAAGLVRADESEPGVQLVEVAIGGDAADPTSARGCRRRAPCPPNRPSWYKFSPAQLFHFTLANDPECPLPEPAGDDRRKPDGPARPTAATPMHAACSGAVCSIGTAATAGTCRGGTPATRTTSSSPRSCCSRRRSTASCRNTRSGWENSRPSKPLRPPTKPTSRRPGGRSATTSGRAGCTPSPRNRWRRYGGELPGDDETLLSFKGIGAYTAGAVLSFAFGQRAAILDTNVARVLFRVFVGRGNPKAHAMRGSCGRCHGRCCLCATSSTSTRR